MDKWNKNILAPMKMSLLIVQLTNHSELAYLFLNT